MVSIICKRLFLSGQYTGSSSVSIVSSLLLLTSSISNSSVTISRQGSGGCTAKTSASTSLEEAGSIFFETRSD